MGKPAFLLQKQCFSLRKMKKTYFLPIYITGQIRGREANSGRKMSVTDSSLQR